MIHTFEILYILNRRAAIYCAHRLNQRVNASKRKDPDDIKKFLRQTHIRKKYEGLQFKGLRLPGIHQIDLLKYKKVPGNFFLYITIEPEVLLTKENTMDVYYCSVPNAKQLQTEYAKAIYVLFPRAFEGRPNLEQVRYADQKTIHPDEWKNYTLYWLPYLPLSILTRVDFCVNYKLDNANLYVELIRKSYYSSRKKEKKFKNLNPFSEDKSHDSLFYDKTSGFCIYNKYNKMMDPKKDYMHNIEVIREEAKDVIRIERPFYKISKPKLYSLVGIHIPKAIEGEEAPLKLGPLPLIYDESVGLRTIFKEYVTNVLGIKRTRVKEYLAHHGEFKWVSLKRLPRELDRRLEAGQITRHNHDTVLKMAYAVSRARSVKKGAANCAANKKIYWDQNEDGKRIEIKYYRSENLFRKTWQTMHEFGMMLLRIPDKREVFGCENNDWEAKELDANFIFDIENNMVGIGTIIEDKQEMRRKGVEIDKFPPYKVIRDYDTPDPLEVYHNYHEVLDKLYHLLNKYAEDSINAYKEH